GGRAFLTARGRRRTVQTRAPTCAPLRRSSTLRQDPLMTTASTRRHPTSRFLDLFRKPRRERLRKKPLARYRPGLERLQDRLAPSLSVTLTGTTVTLDETAGLQNDDTNTALPAAFSSRLTAPGADPATAPNRTGSN